MDNNPQVMEKWIDAATQHGVNVFIFDWYWYDEGPFLESCINDGFLKARNNDKMQFYIMWANHDVKKNYWNVHKYGNDESLLWDASVDWKNFKIIVDRVINQYFEKGNYFKIMVLLFFQSLVWRSLFRASVLWMRPVKHLTILEKR